ncbi:Transmembrane protein 168 [Merluccius polli]|uniref:Transmembrane protein 168 n=1 Tax=Merluccius polli TaxID=89951 RepID=A0AA47MX45_MERPO|nr:Transmembrane protein 168 [Merluccius polli]
MTQRSSRGGDACRAVGNCLRAAMSRLEEVSGGNGGGGDEARRLRSCVRALGFASGATLLAAVGLGLYARCEAGLSAAAPAVFTLAVAAPALCCCRRAAPGLVHLWLGFMLGLLSFTARHRSGSGDDDAKALAADYLLLGAAALRAMWALLDRVCGRGRPAFFLITWPERLELAGFAAAAALAAATGEDDEGSAVLAAALTAVMVALRAKAHLAVANLACLVAVGAALIPAADPCALACFFCRLVFEPLLDNYFGGLSVTERWRPFLAARRLQRLAPLPPLLAAEAVYAAWTAYTGRRWYLTVPALLFWLIGHLVFFITLWCFHARVGDCHRVLLAQGSEVTSLDKVMASKGVRHFCLISQRLVLLTLVSTVLLVALRWPEDSVHASLFLLLLALESLYHGLFHELGGCLGGTCVGYAVVVPTNYCSPDGQPLLLPPDQVQQLNQRSTAMLSGVQRFFAHHLIESFGCDYSTSGLSLDALQAKLRGFLELRTAYGPRHDTYVVYYSGHTHRSGDWALAGGDTLRLDHIVEWWREKNAGACSRLILVLDVDSALPWAKEVRRLGGGLYIAVQGATLSSSSSSSDPERQNAGQLGDFTSRWVEFNCNPRADIRWSEPGRGVSAVYGVSRHWGDYTLHLPTESDVTKHWRTHFPVITYPVVRLALWAGAVDPLWGCGVCLRYLRWFKLHWFPPAILDTGQGFKLVRS